MIHRFGGSEPQLDETVYLAESAQVIGDVTLGPDASVWFGAVVRGDVNFIRIGARTNIQDLTAIHVNRGVNPTIVEDEVTVGHRVVLHGCHVLSRCLIGMGSVVMDDARVGPESIVAAGALVSPGTVVPPRSLALGVPARVVRPLRDEEIELLRRSFERYVELKNVYLREKNRS